MDVSWTLEISNTTRKYGHTNFIVYSDSLKPLSFICNIYVQNRVNILFPVLN